PAAVRAKAINSALRMLAPRWDGMRPEPLRPGFVPARSGTGGAVGLGLHPELLGGEEGPAGVQALLDVAVHEPRQVEHRQADAVVGAAVLGEVVGADLLRALAGPDLALAGRVALALLPGLLHLVELGAQHLHRHRPVL